MGKPKLDPIPEWLVAALQGLTFWIGYKRAMYRDYPLSEGALVTELRSLMHANLPDRLFLKCEIAYSKLVRGERPKPITGQVRADFVVASEIEDEEFSAKWKYAPEFVFELKRAEAREDLIDKDIARLAAFQKARPGARAFLIVLSEVGRHDRFVTEKGTTRVGWHKVRGFPGMYKVRRTVKAAYAFTNKDKGNYATMVEVVANEP